MLCSVLVLYSHCFEEFICVCVGIDYSVKTISVDNSQVALQMWDTAGQER